MKYGIYYAYWAKEWGVDYTPFPKKVASLGFDILEISCAGLKDLPEKDVLALKSAADENGVLLTGGYGPRPEESIASEDPAIVQNAMDFWKKTFAVLEKLGITTVGGGLYGYWPVDYTKEFDKAADLDRSIRNMKALADMAESFGITTLGMESLNRHEGYLINSAKECLDYVKAVDKPNVKVMLDTYHMCIEEDSFRDAILTAGSYLGHLHVGENNRKVPGQGHLIDWKEIADTLHEIGYDGTIVMEPFVIHGGQVGKDIRVWRDLFTDVSEERLDRDAKESVAFMRRVFG
ncbi:MAG: TIM barrel protein [Blautia sp.]|nr:TIM barrel protein [Blautia sp.]